MCKRLVVCIIVVAAMGLTSGCGAGSALSVARNLGRDDSDLKVFLDGLEGKQNKLKKGATGYAKFEIKEPVSTSPRFRYELEEPAKHGFIKQVSMQVHQKFEADFSNLADYVIFSADINNPQAQMKPGVEYDLGNLGPGFRILDKTNKEVSRVEFRPGVEYMLVLTIVADKSESTQIYFKTR